MCGIVGVVNCEPVLERAWLRVARDALTHRGPDDAGEWWSDDGRVGLGHRRLSIIDLSPGGHQPMSSPDGALHIVFNGEIYNFGDVRAELTELGRRFRSESDTEVVIAAYREWGTDCLSRLNGMFAFAVFDEAKGLLFVARDRAGEKPLYYRAEGRSIRFGSELKALLCEPGAPRVIDRQALDCYLAMGQIPGDACIIEGYRKLPPGHALTFDIRTASIKVWRYWRLPALDARANGRDDGELLDQFEALLADSVQRQLVADVPVGVLLSGGVDSSLVTAMAVRASDRVKTFTIGFPGHGAHDETGHARLIARHFATDHTELMAEPATADLLPRLARQFDEPLVDSSMIPTFLVSQLVRQHCTVALGGDGGDELFGGYGHYSRLLWMEDRLQRVPSPIRRGLAWGAERALPLGQRGRNWLQGLGVDLERELPQIASYFDATSRKRLMSSWAPWLTVAEDIWRRRAPADPDLLQRATRMDFETYLANDILVKVDRASMLCSLEVRAPLLDYRLVEFAFSSVPSGLKATPTDKKILLKKLAARVLPAEFDRTRKQGFSIPLAAWLRAGPFRSLFHQVLSDPGCIFDRNLVVSVLRGQDRGRSNSERLFALVLFELWRREYRVTL